VEATEPVQRLLLPASLGRKSYVQRDLDRLGIPFVVADQPTYVARAHVLAKQIPSYYWGPAQVAAYRRTFGLTPSSPQPGSLLYLSREGVQSEAIGREYPSAQVAEIVRRLGGTVFDTRQASPQAFAELAPLAETVVADQGSALFGVLQWQTTRVLEITTDRWWHNANLFFARASGVEGYAVLVCERYDAVGLQKRMIQLLDEIGFFAVLHHDPLARNTVLGG
jgi:capsular polysaccharide biosynthesis protein